MKIGVLSDTHDHLPRISAALELFRQRGAEAIIHAGDIVAPFAARLLAPQNLPASAGLHVVYGNNDGERAGLAKVLPQICDGPLRLELGGRRIVVLHDAAALRPGDTADADIVITGHTHQVVNEVRDRVLWLNPGECCGWLTGRATIMLLDTLGPGAELVTL
jgi:putative phosphoesterase